jgi:hypothetical protein
MKLKKNSIVAPSTKIVSAIPRVVIFTTLKQTMKEIKEST